MNKKEEIFVKNKALENLQRSDGWQIFERFIQGREISLMNSMRKCTMDKLSETRGRLKELDMIKKFLKVETLQGEELLNEIEEFERSHSY